MMFTRLAFGEPEGRVMSWLNPPESPFSKGGTKKRSLSKRGNKRKISLSKGRVKSPSAYLH